MYSQAGNAPQPPDYLSEGELEIFNKIKAELDPTRLEVHIQLSFFITSSATIVKGRGIY